MSFFKSVLNSRVDFNNIKTILTTNLNFSFRDIHFGINPSATSDFVITAFFFFALLPYVSPIPLGSDVQIVSGALGYFIIFLKVYKNQIILSPRELLIILLGVFFILYINFQEPTYQFRKAIGPLYGFSVYFMAKYYKNRINLKLINIVLILYFLGAIVQFISPPLFNKTFEFFIRESKYSLISARGVTSLAPEPSFLGIICIYILIIQSWYYKENDSSKDFGYYLRVFVAVILILMSKSGAGYILLFLYFASSSFQYLRRFFLPISIIVIVSSLVVFNTEKVSGNKGLSDLVAVLQSSSVRDLLAVSSLSNRVNPVIVGIIGAIERPLGRGSGSFTSQASEVYLKNNIDSLYPSYMRPRLLYEISSDSVSTFGKYLFEYGIFFLIYLTLIFSGISFRNIGMFNLFLVLTGLLFSLPIVYPPLWLIFGIYSSKIRINPNKLNS